MFACQLAEASRDLMDEIIALHPKDHSCGCSTGFHAELMCDKQRSRLCLSLFDWVSMYGYWPCFIPDSLRIVTCSWCNSPDMLHEQQAHRFVAVHELGGTWPRGAASGRVCHAGSAGSQWFRGWNNLTTG